MYCLTLRLLTSTNKWFYIENLSELFQISECVTFYAYYFTQTLLLFYAPISVLLVILKLMMELHQNHSLGTCHVETCISKLHEICRLHALIHGLTSLFSSLCNIASLAGNQTSICPDLACTDKTCVCSLSWQLPEGYDDGAERNQGIMTVLFDKRKKNMARLNSLRF